MISSYNLIYINAEKNSVLFNNRIREDKGVGPLMELK